MQPSNQPNRNQKLLDLYLRGLQLLVVVVCFLTAGLFYWVADPYFGSREKTVVIAQAPFIDDAEDPEEVKDGIHMGTGLAFDETFPLIRANCTACHSGKLIAQNRATREGWKEMIIWMQETQKLWDLGENEGAILDYLAKHYAPEAGGRRKPLAKTQWYELKQ